MSENNSGAQVQQSENRNGEQNKDKRQRFDPSKQDAGRRPRSQNHRRRNNGQRQGGYDNKKRDNGDAQTEEKNQGQGRNFDRQNNRNKNNRFKRDQNQGGEKKQFDANPSRRTSVQESLVLQKKLPRMSRRSRRSMTSEATTQELPRKSILRSHHSRTLISTDDEGHIYNF